LSDGVTHTNDNKKKRCPQDENLRRKSKIPIITGKILRYGEFPSTQQEEAAGIKSNTTFVVGMQPKNTKKGRGVQGNFRKIGSTSPGNKNAAGLRMKLLQGYR